MRRTVHALAVLAVFALCATALASPAQAQNAWVPAGTAPVGRLHHSFSPLADGGGLAVGGKASVFGPGLASADRYDAATATWTPAAPMPAARADHAAVTLADGRVLVTGGCAGGAPCDPPSTAAMLWDPATGAWTMAAPMHVARALHLALRLDDGRVMVIGGQGTCNSRICDTLASTELYDPATGTWSDGPALPVPRLHATATPIAGGRVLVAGGCTSSGLPCNTLGSLVYDPAAGGPAGSFGSPAAMQVARTWHLAGRLPSGDVLVTGGVDAGGFVQRSSEIYRVAEARWDAAADSPTSHFGGALGPLPSGDLVLAGGGSSSPVAATELYRSADGSWSRVGALAVARSGPQMAALAGGELVVSGGEGADDDGVAAAERFVQGPGPLLSIDPGALDFGFQALRRSSALLALRLSNIGQAPLHVGTPSIGGGAAGDFSATSHCTTPVAPGASCTIEVRFRPLRTRDRNAVLTIADDAPDAPHAVALQGYGYVDAPSFWAPAGTMLQPRAGHTLTALPDGRAVAIGGGTVSTRAEAWSADHWSLVAAPGAAREGHAATLLADGRILVSGGAASASAEVYDPAADRWSPTGPMLQRRSGHAAARLPSGEVVVFGGCTSGACTSTEVFDPATATWRAGPAMSVPRSAATATPLADGRVLVAGGSALTATELYDPAAGTMTPAGALMQARRGHVAGRLADGRVLLAGGCAGEPCAAAELWDPATQRWRRAPHMALPRTDAVMVATADGRLVVAGGLSYCEPEFGFCFAARGAEAFDGATGRWRALPPMLAPRARFAGTLLPDGQVLVSGGDDDVSSPRDTAERVSPAGR